MDVSLYFAGDIHFVFEFFRCCNNLCIRLLLFCRYKSGMIDGHRGISGYSLAVFRG